MIKALAPGLNETHDPDLSSWLDSASDGTDFPIQNLPFGIFRRADSDEAFRGGVAIGDQILDLSELAKAGLLSGDAQKAAEAASAATLNGLMALGNGPASALRLSLSRLLRAGSSRQSEVTKTLVPQGEADMALPCHIGDYTDFYTSVHHATAIGRQFRPDNPLLPNYKWVPIGYHGRASSIAVSGQSFHRPVGQLKPPTEETPTLGPCKRLDYELELGIVMGAPNALGDPVILDDAEAHIFGFCLLNDWSARDIQGWEYQPLGPFLAKNFASTISPWLVTMEALEPFRATFSRPADDPQPLPYLSSEANSERGGVDIELEVLLLTAQMREQGQMPVTLSRSNFADSYWTVAQLVAHHTVNGCNLRAGDLLGSGTQSGPSPEQAGSLMELSNGGKQAVVLPNGEERTFLEDGDSVILRAYCQGSGSARIGFGEVVGTVLPARV